MLASVVIKIEYLRALHQDTVGILRRPTIPSFPATREPSISSLPAPFLTGSAPQTECDVTHSKQTAGTFLTGARTAFRPFRFSRDFSAHPFASTAKSFVRSRPNGRS